MNDFNIKENYSYLKGSWKLMYNELSAMKEKNDYLTHKIKELETFISSISQRIVTKEEMKDLIKDGLTPITNILLGKEKEMNHTQAQTDSSNLTIEEDKVQIINKVEEVIRSEELDTSQHGGISSLVETEDKRIATGGEDGNISISSYNINEKQWKRDIHHEKAHNKCVTSLCTLVSNRLLSGSFDGSIKLWSISNNNIKLIKEIKEHTQTVSCIIPLTKDRFASCSHDTTVKIWQDDTKFKSIQTLKHEDFIQAILQLKGREILVSCGLFNSPGVTFWELNTFNNNKTIPGYGVYKSAHMIELRNGDIALCCRYDTYPIVIIDTLSYQVKKEIQNREFIIQPSSLCVFNRHSFIYVYRGTFLQISCDDYSIIYQSKGGKFAGYLAGIIPIMERKYLVIQYDKCIAIVKPCCE